MVAQATLFYQEPLLQTALTTVITILMQVIHTSADYYVHKRLCSNDYTKLKKKTCLVTEVSKSQTEISQFFRYEHL